MNMSNRGLPEARSSLLIDVGDGFAAGKAAQAVMPEDGGPFSLYFDVSTYAGICGLRFVPPGGRFQKVTVTEGASSAGALAVKNQGNGSFALSGALDGVRWVCLRGESVAVPRLMLAAEDGTAIPSTGASPISPGDIFGYDPMSKARLGGLRVVGPVFRAAFSFLQNHPVQQQALVRFKQRLYHLYVARKNAQKVSVKATGMAEKAVDFGLLLSPEERLAQQAYVFADAPLISIVVPLYNTAMRFFQELLTSVQLQTYPHWELCLVDASDKPEAAGVSACAAALPASDSRIRYKRLAQNEGIAANTNHGLSMATGAFITLVDHDDILHPAALYEVMRAVEANGADFVYTDETTLSDQTYREVGTHFKPGFAPDTYRSYNYIGHMAVFSRALLEKLDDMLRPDFDGSQDYDFYLRLTEKASLVFHVPKSLYCWRSHEGSAAFSIDAKPYAIEQGRRSVQAHLQRIGLKGEASILLATTYRVRYAIEGNPLVSIIIPNRDQPEMLLRCVRSILEKSTWQRFEICIVENGSRERETFELYESLRRRDSRIQILTWAEGFNYSSINNFAAAQANGEHLLLLNNDTEVIAPDWIEEMLMFSQRPDVGAVGAKLYYANDTIQHAGVVLGIMNSAGHVHRHVPRGALGYYARLLIVQNLTAVTGACLMVARSVFFEVGGLDPSLAIAFNDVDLCMRIRRAGYLNVFTPFAELYHYESISRGADETPEEIRRFVAEVRRIRRRWAAELEAGDPYYNPNLTLEDESCQPR